MNSDYTAPHRVDPDEAGSQGNAVAAAAATRQQTEESRTLPLLTPEIPDGNFSLDFESIMNSNSPAPDEKIQKRVSNLLKLNEENEKLQQELQAMTERLEAAERRRAQLLGKERADSRGRE